MNEYNFFNLWSLFCIVCVSHLKYLKKFIRKILFIYCYCYLIVYDSLQKNQKAKVHQWDQNRKIKWVFVFHWTCSLLCLVLLFLSLSLQGCWMLFMFVYVNYSAQNNIIIEKYNVFTTRAGLTMVPSHGLLPGQGHPSMDAHFYYRACNHVHVL